MPLNPREENALELSYLWTLVKSAKMGVLWTGWNPLTLGGHVNLIQRGYFLLAPMAQVIYWTKLPVEFIYKIAAAVIWWLGAVGMYEYLKKLGAHFWAAIVGGIIYTFLPPQAAYKSRRRSF